MARACTVVHKLRMALTITESNDRVYKIYTAYKIYKDSRD